MTNRFLFVNIFYSPQAASTSSLGWTTDISIFGFRRKCLASNVSVMMAKLAAPESLITVLTYASRDSRVQHRGVAAKPPVTGKVRQQSNFCSRLLINISYRMKYQQSPNIKLVMRYCIRLNTWLFAHMRSTIPHPMKTNLHMRARCRSRDEQCDRAGYWHWSGANSHMFISDVQRDWMSWTGSIFWSKWNHFQPNGYNFQCEQFGYNVW